MSATAGRTGTPQLLWLLREADPATASAAERLLQQILARAGVTGWTAGYRHESGFVLDLAFPGRRVAVEVDGWAWHSDPARFQRDRARQNTLVRGGWTVLRFTWLDLHERPAYVVQTVLEVLARAA